MGTTKSIPVVRLPRDRVVIVTGGNTGVGFETAKFIAMMGAHVIIACRSEEKAKQAIELMNQQFQEEKDCDTQNIISDDRLNVEFMKLDLASLKSTMSFINEFKASGKKLHVLVCNAGIYMHQEVVTEDNFELTYQVNYLSQFLILAHLLPIMKSSGEDCRIVLVTSSAHKYCKYNANYAAGTKMEIYDAFQSYANTKLYQIMQMYSVDRKIEKTNVEIHSVHPGFVKTDLFRRNANVNCKFKCIRCCLSCLCMTETPHKGSATSIYAAVSPDLKNMSRAYLVHSRDAPRFPSSTARDTELQQYLMECTIDNLREYLPEDFIAEFSKS